MNGESERFVDALRQEVRAFRKALIAESDRGCALFAVAYLDKALSDLLYVSRIDGERIERALFDQSGPLGTFTGRIEFAYAHGKISKRAHADLAIIRDIGSDFARQPRLGSFREDSVSLRCKGLQLATTEQKGKPRAQFVTAVLGVLARLHIATVNGLPPEEEAQGAGGTSAEEVAAVAPPGVAAAGDAPEAMGDDAEGAPAPDFEPAREVTAEETIGGEPPRSS